MKDKLREHHLVFSILYKRFLLIISAILMASIIFGALLFLRSQRYYSEIIPLFSLYSPRIDSRTAILLAAFRAWDSTQNIIEKNEQRTILPLVFFLVFLLGTVRYQLVRRTISSVEKTSSASAIGSVSDSIA